MAEPACAGRLAYVMYFVYIISSLTRNWKYTGLTSNIDERLKIHNNGRNISTKAYCPFKLIFTQIVETRAKARDLEKFLKVNYNKEALLDIL